MHIAVVGLGYVGLSLACLLSRKCSVTAVDISSERVDMISRGLSPIKDGLIEDYLKVKHNSLIATTDAANAYRNSDLIIIATPTNYDDECQSFDTSSIESVIAEVVSSGSRATIVIKSTVPVGYTQYLAGQYPELTIMFSPEFLREGHALDDNLHPSRIVVGTTSHVQQEKALQFANMLAGAAESRNVPIKVMGATEAEAIKLFANTYLALRVSFFNELDTYAETKGLNSSEIIEGVCLDPRIGMYYNNPSFGYGGYCLPKDTKQLLANYENVPQNLIRAIVESNNTRKEYIVESILQSHPTRVGIYRLIMKSGSDNFRQSSVLDIISLLENHGVDLLIYEPKLNDASVNNIPVCNDFELFTSKCDLIIANRWCEELSKVKGKVYTRDIWRRD